MRFLHLGLVLSLVLTTKASDDPNHDDSVSENPTGQAAVHGHPKVAAGSSGYRHAPPPYPYKPPKYNSEPHYHDTHEDSDISDYYKDDYHRGVELAAVSGRQKPTSETPLMSSEADSEELTMPPVMTEDNAMMLSDEVQLTNAHESNEAMIEMSEHDKVISFHEFKEILHELVKDAVDKIVMKKAGIMGKSKTAKQDSIGQDGEATDRDPQQSSRAGNFLPPGTDLETFLQSFPHPFSQFSHHPTIKDKFVCLCDRNTFNSRGQGNCNLRTRGRDFNGREWCYLSRQLIADVGLSGDCSDAKPSREFHGLFWSHAACDTKPFNLPFNLSFQERKKRIEELKKEELNSNCRFRTCYSIGVDDSVCLCVNEPELVQDAVGEIVTDAGDGIVTDVDKIVMKEAGIV